MMKATPWFLSALMLGLATPNVNAQDDDELQALRKQLRETRQQIEQLRKKLERLTEKHKGDVSDAFRLAPPKGAPKGLKLRRATDKKPVLRVAPYDGPYTPLKDDGTRRFTWKSRDGKNVEVEIHRDKRDGKAKKDGAKKRVKRIFTPGKKDGKKSRIMVFGDGDKPHVWHEKGDSKDIHAEVRKALEKHLSKEQLDNVMKALDKAHSHDGDDRHDVRILRVPGKKGGVRWQTPAKGRVKLLGGDEGAVIELDGKLHGLHGALEGADFEFDFKGIEGLKDLKSLKDLKGHVLENMDIEFRGLKGDVLKDFDIDVKRDDGGKIHVEVKGFAGGDHEDFDVEIHGLHEHDGKGRKLHKSREKKDVKIRRIRL